jgi:uncharacterized protein YggE
MRLAYTAVGLLMVASFGVGLFSPRSQGQPGAAAGADATHRKITVTGTATVAVKPDTARVSFAVKGTGADFKAAVKECDAKADAVRKAVADLKLNGLEVKFGPINLLAPAASGAGPGGPPGDPAGPAPRAAAVEVTRTFTVVTTFGGKDSAGELKDIVAVADRTLAAAVAAGATEPPSFNSGGIGFGGIGFGGGGISGNATGNSRVEFSRSNLGTLRQEALKLAVADAIANARAAGGVANLTARDIVSLSDQVQYNGIGVLAIPTNSGRGEVLGEQDLTVQVIVTFNF